MRIAAILSLGLLAIGCANVRHTEVVTPAAGAGLSTAPGGIVLRIDRSKDLPNAFGGRDIYGGKVALGFSELRFLGVSPDGGAKLKSTDVRVQSSESTMTRYGVGGPLPTLDRTRSEAAPEGVEFTAGTGDSLAFHGYRITILSVAGHELVYDLARTSSD